MERNRDVFPDLNNIGGTAEVSTDTLIEEGYLKQDLENPIDENVLVSTNLFGFTKEIFTDATRYFEDFLKDETNLETKEFYLPTVVQKSIDDNLADVKILSTNSKFNGMTYKEDLKGLKENIQELINSGVYPDNLWED